MQAVIVEDSRLARQELRALLRHHPEVVVTGEAGDAQSALELIRSITPDLVFLDIHLPGKSGFEILQELESVPEVIFTTAFDQYALQAFEYNALDYLLKPVVPSRLAQAIGKVTAKTVSSAGKAGAEIPGGERRIFVKDGSKCWFVRLADVRLFESKGNYTRIYFGDQQPMVLRTLQQLEDGLDGNIFLRINRQQILNTRFVRSVSACPGQRLLLELATGETVEVSRRQVQRFQSIFRL
ncbi:DNA-binding response regulator [Mucilaginibacter conchicola]|uniref:DNA-binding response regulator n=1 Tax=Mucilaginibacter conchicola TaxID=2303333 RepID=A0A372NR07_9SPHI|nr:DNA-binding response regulator [Mucilaginibacter conchicola]